MFKRIHNRAFLSLLLALFTMSSPLLAEEEGGGGGGAGKVLQGLAGIIGAATPAVVAGIQAQADVSIAKTNSNAQITMGGIQAETSKYQATASAETSIFQTLAAMGINKNNNDAQTQRLGMMLNEAAYERQIARQSEIEKRKIELDLNRQRIALAFQEEDDRFKTEMAKINLIKAQAGLGNGYVIAKSSVTTTPVKSGLLAAAKSSVNQPSMGVLGLASGSTRAVRKRGVSDLASFQESVQVKRGIASNERGLVRHVPVEERLQAGLSSHSSGGSNDVFRIGRAVSQ